MTWSDLWPVLASSAAPAVAWGITAFVSARVIGRNNVIDTLWPLGFLLIALVAIVVAAGDSGDPLRQALLVACTGVWALRLGWFVGRRSAGKADDPRYVDLLAEH